MLSKDASAAACPRHLPSMLMLLLAGVGLTGCKILPRDQVEALRARNGGTFEEARYVDTIWPARVNATLRQRAVALADLRTGDVDALGAGRGHRAGEGSPWTFAVRGEGVVRAITRGDPRGRVTLDTAAGPVVLQVGPVVSGTAIRDALPFVTFDGFPDQTSFSEVGMAITDRALAPLRGPVASLRAGDRLRFLGAASIVAPDEPFVVTPVLLERTGAAR